MLGVVWVVLMSRRGTRQAGPREQLTLELWVWGPSEELGRIFCF